MSLAPRFQDNVHCPAHRSAEYLADAGTERWEFEGMSVFDAEPQDIADLVAAYPLAIIVSGGPAEFAATPLPLLGETDEKDRLTSLFGHFARSNAQVAALQRVPQATIIFQGPQRYISPTLVSKPSWGPTWNYAVVRFDVDIEFVPEETGDAVWRLARSLEGDAPSSWTPASMGDRYHELLQNIIAFRAQIRSISARFKLGQDEAEATFDEIVGGIPDHDLTSWMLRMRRRGSPRRTRFR